MNISKKFLLFLSTAAVGILILSCPISAQAKSTGTVTGSVVNLRQKPNLSSKVLNQLTEGTKVSVEETDGDWHKVIYNDLTGWMHRDYLAVSDEKIAAGVVNGSVVNVRSKADISSEVIAKLEKNTNVDIYDSEGDWYRVSIGEERYGWMHKDYVTVKEEADPKNKTAAKTATQTQEATKEPEAAKPEESQEGAAADEAGVSAAGTSDEAAGAGEEQTEKKPDLADRGSDKLNAEARKEAALRQEIVDYAKTLLGVKYKYGGNSPKGFDCSGFVKYVYNHFDMKIERTSSDQSKGGKAVKKADLQPGDLVFFDTNGGMNNITHVGIYIGDGKFIHASTYDKRVVTIESLSTTYYSKRFMKARDYISK